MFSIVNMKTLLGPLNTRRLLSIVLALFMCLQLTAATKDRKHTCGGYGLVNLIATIIFLAGMAFCIFFMFNDPAALQGHNDAFNQSQFLFKLGAIGLGVAASCSMCMGAFRVFTTGGSKDNAKVFEQATRGIFAENTDKKMRGLFARWGTWVGIFGIALMVVSFVLTKNDNLDDQKVVRAWLLGGILTGACLIFVSSLMIKKTLTGKFGGRWSTQWKLGKEDAKKGFTIGHMNVIVSIVLILAIFFTGKNSDFIGAMGGNSTHFAFITACVCTAFLLGSVGAQVVQRNPHWYTGGDKVEGDELKAKIVESKFMENYVLIFSIALTVGFVCLALLGGNMSFKIPLAGDAGHLGGMKFGLLAIAAVGFFGCVSVIGNKIHRRRKLNKLLKKQMIQDNEQMIQSGTVVYTRPEPPVNVPTHPVQQDAPKQDALDGGSQQPAATMVDRRRVLERLLQKISM